VASYLDMQLRIADELDRGSELTAQIKKAIVTAVDFYQRKKFYFTETSFTFSTVVGQEYYGSSDAAAIATSPDLSILNIDINAGRFQLDKQSFEYIDSISYLTGALGQPTIWAYRAEQIRFYPIPSQVWTVTAFNIPRLTALSADGDSNAWTNDAEALIRTAAKIDLIYNVIRGTDMVEEIALLKDQERRELAALFAEGASRAAKGVLTPTSF
jgi:hypothetical protein